MNDLHMNENYVAMDEGALDSVTGGKFQEGTPADELWKKLGVTKNGKKMRLGKDGKLLEEEENELLPKKNLGMR